MKKDFFFLGLFLLLLSAFANAQADLVDVDCYSNYNFGGLVFTELYSGKTVYSPGDNVSVNYAFANAFQSPLPEGAVKAVVLYRGPEDVDRMEDELTCSIRLPVRAYRLAAITLAYSLGACLKTRCPEYT
jgi:hypothetical protein